jgi:hypothetical protein
MRGDAPECACDEGWTGINCNVCTQDKACDPLMETKDGGVCYQMGEVVDQNHQMCDVTNKQILAILEGKIPQVTFSCKKETGNCDFQCTWFSIEEILYRLVLTRNKQSTSIKGSHSSAISKDAHPAPNSPTRRTAPNTNATN